MINGGIKEKKDSKISIDSEKGDKLAIVLYNDDVNTFDFVISTLMEVCEHTSEQAEQCAYLTHYKGKCDVKHGTPSSLQPCCEALCNRGLSAKIE